MSRIGKKPIPIPKGVEVKIEGSTVSVKGPKGTAVKKAHPAVKLSVENNEVRCTADAADRLSKSVWGLWRVLINNMIMGVTAGYKKTLDIQGVGYKAEMKGKDLNIVVGYSHPVVIKPAPGITFKTETATRIIIEGIDKEAVGETTAEIRLIRGPEPYKGKGIRYLDEHVRRKVGKAAGK
ncbi:MAG TPA: 50S ribosomal protein L6 [Chitinivibrionales bacterium]|nr:50S ribosomal protein L6 [Chitinivibrionales bacterium]